MFDGGLIMSLHALNCPPPLLSNANKTLYRRTRPTSPLLVPLSLLLAQTLESGNFPVSRKTSCSGAGAAVRKRRCPKHLLNQANTVGIIGGASVSSTLIFLEKLVLWSARDAGGGCLPFVVCSDPSLNEQLISSTLQARTSQIKLNHSIVVENLQRKRAFLEKSGAGCIVMPCHILHTWHTEISEGCSLPFLHVGECVARELKEAKLKPLEAGSGVRIGLLATDGILSAGFYQEKLQSQGFEVVLPDKATMEHILIPAAESLKKRDMEGAQNLLRVAIQVLLVRAVNAVVLASDDMQGVLPHDDPLLKKCIDPMDALARSTIKWGISVKKVPKRSK